MQPTRLTISGVTRFGAPLTVDMSNIPPGLIAIVGGNGEGKTTLLEAMCPAPLWLEMPTRAGALADNCTARDSRIELDFRHGDVDYSALVQIDIGKTPKSRSKTEAWLRVDGEPVTDGKVKTYGEAIAEHLPPQHLVMASAFASQDGGGSFGALDVHGRRALFRTMLGLDALQTIAKRAAEHRRPLDAQIAELDRHDQRLRDAESVLRELQSKIDEATKAEQPLQDAATKAAAASTQATASASTKAALLGQLEDARRVALDTRDRLRLRLETSNNDLEQASTALAAANATRATSAAVHEAAAEAEMVRDARATAAATYREQAAEINRCQQMDASLCEERLRSIAEHDRTAEDLQQAAAAIETLSKLERAASGLATARAARPGAATAHRQATDAHRRAADAARGRLAASVRLLDGARRELEGAEALASKLDGVPCKGGDVALWDAGPTHHTRVDCGECPLIRTAVDARRLLPEIGAAVIAAEAEGAAAHHDTETAAGLRATVDEAAQVIGALDKKIAELAGADTRVQTAQAAIDRQPALQQRRDEAAQRTARTSGDLDKCRGTWDAAIAQQAAAEQAGRAARVQLDALGDTAARLADLHAAEGRAPVLQRTVATSQRDRTRAAADLEALDVPPEPVQQHREVAQLRAVAREAIDVADATSATLATHRGALHRLLGERDAIGDLPAKRSLLTERRDLVAARRSGFVLLERAFGPEGIQALENDAAGPGVSAIANQLLRTNAGAGYTIELRTIREAGGHRKQKEVFDIIVHDGRSGTSRELGRMSGGEQVLVEEAIKLAIAVHVAQRTDTAMDTIWRDECDGALSPENADRYPAMLREALKLGGFTRCYFITHRPSVAVQADTVLLVEGGTVRVLDPGDYAALHSH